MTTDILSSAIVAHRAKTSGSYLGSPSLLRLADGTLLASHDFFGPRTLHNQIAIHASSDDGATWSERARFHPAFWGSLFAAGDDIYFLSVDREYGRLVIRRSTDGGYVWSHPADDENGVIGAHVQFHRAPVPITEFQGRLYTAVEDAGSPTDRAATRYGCLALSAPADADLLRASSWTFTSVPLRGQPDWLGGTFDGWLEGNLVATPEGLKDVMRVHNSADDQEFIALISVDPHDLRMTFDPESDFIPLPGGSKKFTLRQDRDGTWWTIVNAPSPHGPRKARNQAVLMCSPDLRAWERRATLLRHPDPDYHAFQYVDLLIEGDSLLVLSRTAADDSSGCAANFHDSNFITYHRVPNFRSLRES